MVYCRRTTEKNQASESLEAVVSDGCQGRRWQFSLRSIMLAMFALSIVMSLWKTIPEWVVPVVIVLGSVVEHYIRRHFGWLNSQAVSGKERQEIGVWTRIGAAASGALNGGILVFFCLVVCIGAQGKTIDLLATVKLSAALGLMLGIIFPRFFRNFILPIPC